jgi:hypothetical protein
LSYSAKNFAALGKIARTRCLENGKMRQGKNEPIATIRRAATGTVRGRRSGTAVGVNGYKRGNKGFTPKGW